MKSLVYLLCLAAFSRAMIMAGQKMVQFDEDGKILITTPTGKEITIQRPMMGGSQGFEMLIKGPFIPTKRIQIKDVNEEPTTESNWEMDSNDEYLRSKRSKVVEYQPISQHMTLSNTLKEFQVANDAKAYQKLLKKIEKLVLKGELNPKVYDIMSNIDMEEPQSKPNTMDNADLMQEQSTMQIMQRYQINNPQVLEGVAQQLYQQYLINGQQAVPQVVLRRLLQKLYMQNQMLQMNQPLMKQLLMQLLQENGGNMVFVEEERTRLLELINQQNQMIKEQMVLQLIRKLMLQSKMPQNLIQQLLHIMYEQAQVNNEQMSQQLIQELQMKDQTVMEQGVKLLQLLNIQNQLMNKQVTLQLLKGMILRYQLNGQPEYLQTIIRQLLQKLNGDAQIMRQPMQQQIYQNIMQENQNSGSDMIQQQKIEIIQLLKQQDLVQVQQLMAQGLQQIMQYYEQNGQMMQQILQNMYDQNDMGHQLSLQELKQMRKEAGPALSLMRDQQMNYPMQMYNTPMMNSEQQLNQMQMQKIKQLMEMLSNKEESQSTMQQDQSQPAIPQTQPQSYQVNTPWKSISVGYGTNMPFLQKWALKKQASSMPETQSMYYPMGQYPQMMDPMMNNQMMQNPPMMN